MTRQRVAVVALGIAAASSCAMAAYHFALPFIWRWSRVVGDVPATIRWGLFAINVFFSFLLLAGGVLTAAADAALTLLAYLIGLRALRT